LHLPLSFIKDLQVNVMGTIPKKVMVLMPEMSRRQSLAPPETFQISSDTQWEEVGLEAEEGMEAEEEEAPAGRSTSPKTRKPLMNKVGKPRMAVRRTTPSSSSAPATPDPQTVANMAMELAQKMMSAQGLLNKQGQDPQMPDELYEEDFEEQRGAKTRGTYMNESSDGTSNNLIVEPDGTSGSLGDFEDPETYEPVVPDRQQPSSRPIDPVETLLNRGQRTTVLRGLQRAKEVNALFQEALGDPPDGVALVAKDASASTTTRLVRDRWIGTFGPPMTLMTDGGSEFSGTLESVLRTFQVYHDVVPPTAHWRMALAERHGAVLKLMLMKIIKEKSVMGLEEMKSAAACATAARNYQARVSGFSPVQLVFGRENPIPGNLMDVLEKGHMMYHLTDPMNVEDSMRRTLDIKKAAEEAFGWLQAHDALKKAAASRARLPRLELLSEGLAVADEIEAQNISSEAFELIEKELTEGRTKALVAPEVPQLTDKNYPVMEFSDDDEPRHVDEEETKTASVLDDVPMAMHKGGHEREVETLRDPALWPFPKRKQVFEPKMSLDQAAQRTKHHLQEMKMKLEGKSTGAAASSSARATAGDTTAAEHSAAAPAKADRKKKGDQNPKSAKAPRTALVVEGVRSVLESYVVLPLQSPLETVWHDGDEAAMINKAAEEFEPKPDFPSPWLPAPGMVDLMPPRHFVGFEQTPVVKSPEHEVNYTRGTWEKPWPNTPVPHVHVPKHVDMLPEMPPALTQPISEAQMRSLTRAKIMWPDQDSWIYDADIEELWRVHQCPREKLFVPQEPTWPSSIKRDWFVGPRVTWMYFEDEPEVVVVDNFRWQGCNPSLRTTDGRLWRGFTRFWVRVPSPISDLNAWIDARVMVEELWRAAQQMMSLYFREKDEYKVDWNEVFVLQADVADM
ncbi:Uncharacterized protein SCF082_LOCUS1772, partial [Durusdinium trenchii]